MSVGTTIELGSSLVSGITSLFGGGNPCGIKDRADQLDPSRLTQVFREHPDLMREAKSGLVSAYSGHGCESGMRNATEPEAVATWIEFAVTGANTGSCGDRCAETRNVKSRVLRKARQREARQPDTTPDGTATASGGGLTTPILAAAAGAAVVFAVTQS